MYAHWALQNLHILPSEFEALSLEEKGFIIASIDLRVEGQREQARQMEKEAKRHR